MADHIIGVMVSMLTQIAGIIWIRVLFGSDKRLRLVFAASSHSISWSINE